MSPERESVQVEKISGNPSSPLSLTWVSIECSEIYYYSWMLLCCHISSYEFVKIIICLVSIFRHIYCTLQNAGIFYHARCQSPFHSQFCQGKIVWAINLQNLHFSLSSVYLTEPQRTISSLSQDSPWWNQWCVFWKQKEDCSR